MYVTTDFKLGDILTFRVTRPISRLRDAISNPEINYKNLISIQPVNPDIVLKIGPFEPDLTGCVSIDNCYFIRNDYIYFKDSYKIANWRIALSGFETGPIHIQIQCDPFGLIFSIGILELMMRILAVRKGYAFIHSFGIQNNGWAGLFPARSGVGKTTSSTYFLEKGYKVVSDNFVIIKDSQMFAFPTPMLIFKYNLTPALKKRLASSTLKAISMKNLLYRATLGYAKFLTPVQLNQAFPGQQTTDVPINDLILTLAGGQFQTESDIPKKGLARAMAAINKFETFYFLRMMESYALCFPKSQLAGHWTALENVFRRTVNAVSCHRMIVPELYTKEIFDQTLGFTASLQSKLK